MTKVIVIDLSKSKNVEAYEPLSHGEHSDKLQCVFRAALQLEYSLKRRILENLASETGMQIVSFYTKRGRDKA